MIFLKLANPQSNNERVSVKRSLSPDLKHTHIRRISSFSANVTSENGIYTAHLNFNYGNNIVGTAKLTLSSDENIAAASNLPFAKDDNNSNLKQKQCIVINIWVIVAVIAAILIVLYIHSEVKRRKKQRRRYSGRKYL